MQVTDITVPIEHAPDEFGTGLNWAEAAVEAWLAAARKAGLSVDVRVLHGRESQNRAATVEADGVTYALEANNGVIAAVPVR